MIYTIGYQGMNIDFFMQTLHEYGIGILIDVRSKPTGWNPAFRQKALENRTQREGIQYRWYGETLGGFAKIEEKDIKNLAEFVVSSSQTVCLMCMEADPLKCHRHHQLAERLKEYGVPVSHILKDGVKIIKA